jgi:hypothetical protein
MSLEMEISQNLSEENSIACQLLVMENSAVWKPGRIQISFFLMSAYYISKLLTLEPEGRSFKELRRTAVLKNIAVPKLKQP